MFLYPPHVDLCFEALVVKREKLRKFCCSRETSIHKTSGFTGRLDSKMLKNELEFRIFESTCQLECWAVLDQNTIFGKFSSLKNQGFKCQEKFAVLDMARDKCMRG